MSEANQYGHLPIEDALEQATAALMSAVGRLLGGKK